MLLKACATRGYRSGVAVLQDSVHLADCPHAVGVDINLQHGKGVRRGFRWRFRSVLFRFAVLLPRIQQFHGPTSETSKRNHEQCPGAATLGRLAGN